MGFWQNEKIEKQEAEILRLRAENEKLRADLKRDYGGVLDRLEEQVLEIERLWAALTPFTNYLLLESDKEHDTRPVLVKHLRAAAAALKETGDEQ